MQRILSYMRKAIEEYNMIEEGDKIAVCLSGGKDSITMLHGFKALQRFYPKKFEIVAVSIHPGFEFFDTNLLQSICDKIEVPLFIEESHIKEIVFDIRNEKNPCSLCANLRRGIINKFFHIFPFRSSIHRASFRHYSYIILHYKSFSIFFFCIY